MHTTTLDQLLAHLVSLRVASRDDMKRQIDVLLRDYQIEILDTHNTSSMIFIFTADDTRYGLKIEYGQAEVMRDEVHWYDLAPADLKTHHVVSHVGEHYAFVVLRWLQNARTVEEVAIANEGKDTAETIDLLIKALNQDRELFASNPTIPIQATEQSGYFFEKYYAYNAAAKDYPYLQQLLDSEHIRINGKTIPGPNKFVQAVQQNNRLRTYVSPDQAGMIHGDSHADNLLVEDDRVYLVDPKGVDHLPLEYDTGRMIWSLTGWNAIVRGEFGLSEGDDGYQLSYKQRQQYVDGLARFRACFTDQEYHRAMYSAAMQYITRVSHAANQSEATALYLRGLQVFDQLFAELGEGV